MKCLICKQTWVMMCVCVCVCGGGSPFICTNIFLWIALIHYFHDKGKMTLQPRNLKAGLQGLRSGGMKTLRNNMTISYF